MKSELANLALKGLVIGFSVGGGMFGAEAIGAGITKLYKKAKASHHEKKKQGEVFRAEIVE